MRIIIGDSHVTPLRKGLEQMAPSDKARIEKIIRHIRMIGPGRHFLHPFYQRSAGCITLTNPTALEATKDIFVEGRIEPSETRLTICAGFHGVWLISSALWEQYSINPERRDRQFISSAAFEKMVLNLHRYLLAFYSDLQEAGISFEVLSSPPLPECFYPTTPPRPTTPDECWRLDREFKAIFRRELERRGIPFVLPPEGICEGGKLRADLGSGVLGDHHGNAQLGRIYLDMLVEEPPQARGLMARMREFISQ